MFDRSGGVTGRTGSFLLLEVGGDVSRFRRPWLERLQD